jgi:pSer/pThr/pTyr-binding forkhead associated (FHA) protein
MKDLSFEATESITAPEKKATRVELHQWSVEVASGPDKGRKVSTLDALVRVGSDPSNDLVLTDPTVSRRHIEIERRANGLLLRDLGSRNGTFVEGRQILQVYLTPGDKVVLGKTKLAVKQESKATSVEVAGADSFGELDGISDQMRMVFAELRRISREDMNLLIEGETGTGKELAARAVHAHSARRHGPFRVVDCNLLSDEAADRELFGALRGEAGVMIFYEAPDRVGATLADLAAALGAGRRASLARELTKVHEEHVRGTLAELAARYAETAPRGECTLVVEGAAPDASGAAATEIDIEAELRRLLDAGLGPRDAAARLVIVTGKPRRHLYQLALSLSRTKS